MSIDQAVDYGLKMNKSNSNGDYTQVGFIPWDGQGFWATWCLMYGASFFNNNNCTMDLELPADARRLQALREMGQGSSTTTRSTPSSRPTNRPGLRRSRASSTPAGWRCPIDGNFALPGLNQFAPKLKYGVTYLPVVKKGDPPFTWCGGFAMVMPKGPANAEGGWKFLKYVTGPEGQKIYSQVTSHLPTYKSLLKVPSVIKGQEFFAEILKYATLPPAAAGQRAAAGGPRPGGAVDPDRRRERGIGAEVRPAADGREHEAVLPVQAAAEDRDRLAAPGLQRSQHGMRVTLEGDPHSG